MLKEILSFFDLKIQVATDIKIRIIYRIVSFPRVN